MKLINKQTKKLLFTDIIKNELSIQAFEKKQIPKEK